MYPDRVFYLQGDATKLAFSDNSFSAVLAFDILEHVPDYGTALSECRRVLEPNGLLLVTFPCEGQPWTLHNALRATSIGKLRYKLHGHVQCVDQKGLVAGLEEAGFWVIDRYYAVHWLSQLGDTLGDVLMDSGRYSRDELYSSKAIRALLMDPRLAMYAVLWKLGYYESRLLRRIGFNALVMVAAAMPQE